MTLRAVAVSKRFLNSFNEEMNTSLQELQEEGFVINDIRFVTEREYYHALIMYSEHEEEEEEEEEDDQPYGWVRASGAFRSLHDQ